MRCAAAGRWRSTGSRCSRSKPPMPSGSGRFDPEGSAPLLISAGRAATLKLANQRDAATPDGPVLVERVAWLDFDTATALADPQFDLATPLKGPFRAIPLAEP